MSRILLCALIHCCVALGQESVEQGVHTIDEAPAGYLVPTVVFLPAMSDNLNISQVMHRYLEWCLGVSGIKCSNQGVVSGGDKVYVTTKIAAQRGYLKLYVVITDICNIAEYEFEVHPGEWYQMMRQVADKIVAAVLARSAAFSTPVFAVVRRAEDGRQEVVRAYLDGIDSTPIGESARQIYDIYPEQGGILYTLLKNSEFAVKRYLHNGTAQDIKIQSKYLLYEFSIQNKRVVFTRLTSNGAELGLVEGLEMSSYIDDRNTKVLHSGEECVMISPSLSPSGTQVAFVSNNNMLGKYTAQVLDINDGSIRCIGNFDRDVEMVCWSPCDPDILAVLTQEPEGYRVCLINKRGDVIRMSEVIGKVNSISWKCDGSGILVCVGLKARKNSCATSSVYVMPAHSMQLHSVCGDVGECLRVAM